LEDDGPVALGTEGPEVVAPVVTGEEVAGGVVLEVDDLKLVGGTAFGEEGGQVQVFAPM